MADSASPYVSRGGDKLQAALDGLGLDVADWLCADFGANVGGFTDCLLQRGARRIWAVDTGYGELAWKLRKDPRVVVMERTNALYTPPPPEIAPGVDLVAIDVAFTCQRLIVPAAGKWLKPLGHIVSLLKPYYELSKMRPVGRAEIRIDFSQACRVCDQVCQQLDELGFRVLAVIESPIKGKGGNTEFLLHLEGKNAFDLSGKLA